MKRKIFSKLLMVALVIAAVGSFVSCKDYDDDINNLQKQIDAKAALSELTALQSTLDSKIAAAKSAADAAQATANAAATKTSVAELKTALEAAIADAKKAGTDAGTQAGTAIAAANKAQETADAAAAAAKKADEDAKAALADALKTIEETYQTKAEAAAAAKEAAEALAAVKTIAEAAYTKAEAEKLQEQVNNLKADLESAIDEKIDAKIKEVNNAVASVDAIWGAITSVELYASNKSLTGADNVDELYFLKGTEVTNSFGAAVIPAGNAALPYDGHEISEIKNYKAGDPIKFDNRIIVRVNPANATFTADDVVLIDSKGNALNDLVDVAVEPYTQLLTRGDFNSGLYVISFTRKGTATEADFAEATEGEVYDAEKKPMLCEGAALYAIGINNSKDAAEKRYVNTAFNIGVNYGDYERQNDFSFVVRDIVGDKDIADLHNRWKINDDKLVGEDETAEKVVPGKWNAELVWAPKSDDNATAFANHVDTASVSGQKEAKYRNWAYGDYRYANDTYVVVDKDKRTFTIMGIDAVNKGFIGADLNLVQYYYVTLDRYAAVESAPSEWESWNSYSYTGLYTVTPAIDNLRITIDSEEAVGDIIGFRVFAVNYDGSLADPDGMAFYVQVGKPEAAKDKTFNAYWTANVQTLTAATIANASTENKDKAGLFNTGVTDISAAVAAANFKDITLTNAQKTGTATFSSDDYADDIALTGGAATDITVNWALLKSVEADGTFTATNYASKWTEIKYVALGVNDPGHVLDGATDTKNKRAGSLPLTFEGKDADHHDKVVNKMTINVIKQLPSTPTGFAWRSTYAPNGTTWTVYPEPNAWFVYGTGAAMAWNGNDFTVTPVTNAERVRADFNTFATGVDASYVWKFFTKNDKKTEADWVYYTGTNAPAQNIIVNGDNVGDAKNKTAYGVLSKTIAQVRCVANATDAAPTALQDYPCEVFAGNVVFESAINKFTYSLVPYTYFSAWPAAATAGTAATSTKVAVLFNVAAQSVYPYNLGYKAAATAYTYEAGGGNDVAAIKLSDILKGTNSAISPLTGKFALANYQTITVKVTNASGVEDLIEAVTPVADAITFKAVAGATAPLTKVEETVTLTLVDVFGNKTTTSFPINILPAKLEPGFVE